MAQTLFTVCPGWIFVSSQIIHSRHARSREFHAALQTNHSLQPLRFHIERASLLLVPQAPEVTWATSMQLQENLGMWESVGR